MGYPPAMRFRLIDDVLEQEEDRILAVKNVTNAEEYLADHFPSFPVLPGVLMLEALVQAARTLLGRDGRRMVLGKVGPTRYGNFVRPGEALYVEVRLISREEDGSVKFKGTGRVVGAGQNISDASTCVSSRFTMRPPRIGPEGIVSKAADSSVSTSG